MNLNQSVSIIMPAYNTEKYVAAAIESVLNQTYSNWELLMINDGSTDETGRIMDLYAAKDRRIHVFHTENRGVSHARNVGLENASGMWIVFLDSDDCYPKDAIETLIANSENSDLVIGNNSSYPQSTEPIIKESAIFSNFRELEPLFHDMFGAGYFSGIWGKLIRRSVIHTPFCEEYHFGEDILFFSGLITSVKQIKLINNIVYQYRTDNGTSLTHRYVYDDYLQSSYLRVYETVCRTYISFFNNPEQTLWLNSFFLRRIVNTVNSIIKDSSISESEKRSRLAEVMDSTLLQSLPLQQYYLSPREQRRATLLLIGDSDLIMKEYSNNRSPSREKKTKA